MCSSSHRIRYPSNLLHGMIEPQWLPRSVSENDESSLSILERAEEEQATRLRAIVLPNPSSAPIGCSKSMHMQHHHPPQNGSDTDGNTAKRPESVVDVLFIKSQAAMSAPINRRFWQKYAPSSIPEEKEKHDEPNHQPDNYDQEHRFTHHHHYQQQQQPSSSTTKKSSWQAVRFSFQKHATSSLSTCSTETATESAARGIANNFSTSSSRLSMGSAMSILLNNSHNTTSSSYYSVDDNQDDLMSPVAVTAPISNNANHRFG